MISINFMHAKSTWQQMEQIEKAMGKQIIRIETNDLDEIKEDVSDLSRLCNTFRAPDVPCTAHAANEEDRGAQWPWPDLTRRRRCITVLYLVAPYTPSAGVSTRSTLPHPVLCVTALASASCFFPVSFGP